MMSTKVKKSDHGHSDDLPLFGFWLYLLTDLALFATLFATFVVLRPQIAGGPSSQDIIELPFVLTETMILLLSSFTAGLGLIAFRQKNKNQSLAFLVITFLLGLTFIGMELTEFSKLISEGHDWQVSAFLSAFFTLVATHGLHISFGLIWLLFMMVRIAKSGFNDQNHKRLTMFSMFWHFLDIVWIFIFTIVYLMGVK